MTIQYSNGIMVEAILLSRAGERMRVAVRGSAEALEFVEYGGIWISEECEPVQIEFAWQRKTRRELLDEADCVCSRELASRLIHHLLTGEEQPSSTWPPTAPSGSPQRTAKAATA
ncbi:MAG: hypothetical protein ABSH45_10890 [Bryobacteraceae bacterium]|jgi:hypothetical protein